MLKGFLYNESHSYQIGARLLDQVQHAEGGISIGEKIVDKEHIVFGGEEVGADNYFIVTIFGEGVYSGTQCGLNGFGRFLFGKYNGEVHEVAGHDGGGNATGFYGHDFIDIGGGEAANKFYSDGFH